jgi:glycosyltransferase involved in cell wall biosynthesis
MTLGPVRPLILLPVDPLGTKVSGMRSFVEGFVAFAPEDFEPTIVGVSEGPLAAGSKQTTITLAGREVAFLPLLSVPSPNKRRRIPLAAAYSWQLLRQRRGLPVDGSVIQIHRPGSDLPVLGVPVPKVRFIHLDVASGLSESRWRRLPGALNAVESRTLRRMARVYIVSHELYDTYGKRYPQLAGRMRFISNWFDERLFAPATKAARGRVRAELGLAADDEIVLFVGRLEEQKNPILLIDTAAALMSTREHIRLHVVGEGTQRESTERRARELGIQRSVRFWGSTPRALVARLMAASDVLCISSTTEAGPTVGYEALASGLPVVMTPVGEVARVLKANPDAGLVVDPTSEQLAAGIVALLDRPQERRRRAAVAAAGPFSASAVLAPVYEDHRELVELAAERSARAAS